MAGDITILTSNQKQFLDVISKEPTLCNRIYFTGGTALAEFYLHHRLPAYDKADRPQRMARFFCARSGEVEA